MKIKSFGFALSILAFSINNCWAEPPYPNYKSAVGISAKDQVAKEALWLHLNASRFGNATIPKSFDVSNYWNYMVTYNPQYQLYRQTNDNGTCSVDPSNNATIERAMQQQGLDIYDGAVWQIALAIVAKTNPQVYLDDVIGYKNFMVTGVTSGFQSYYAFKNYTYNGVTMPTAKNAYLLKFISPTWANNYDPINDCNMTWPEWSAVTGEEAWSVLIGPVQSLYLINDGAHNPDWASSGEASDFLQLGKNALGAIKQMQAPSGGVYRNVALPGEPQDLDISLENNFSLYAGLSILEQGLKARIASLKTQLNLLKASKDKMTQLKAAQSQQIIASDEADIDTINTIKKRMVQFFAGQGGVSVYNTTGKYFYTSVNGNTPYTKDFAVDVQTWGATVIASTKKDVNDSNDPDLLQTMINTYGPDVMYNILQMAIIRGGYLDSTNHNLLGVGFTAQTSTDPWYELSGEWTFGAINAAIVLADHYKKDTDKYAILTAEAKKMLAGVTMETSNLEGSLNSPTSRINYLYANKRILIPFGWYSNKVPSTASTAWSLMVNSCFNPFELGGGNYQAICQQLNLG